MARLWVVVVVFALVGVVRSAQVGVPFRDPGGAWLVSRVALTVVIALALVVLDTAVRTVRAARADGVRPTGRLLLATGRARWTPARLALTWAVLLAYNATWFVYHNLKSWDAFNLPRDALLAGWDRTLLGGHVPAVVLHDLLGRGVATHVLATWYETFGTLVLVAFPAVAVLAPRLTQACAGIAAFVWTWVLGTAGYYLIPSSGPFHSAPQHFADLPHTSIQDTQQRYMSQVAHLLAHPEAHDAYAQVSAFPSLHVGVTATILGAAWWHRLRGVTAVLGVYLVGTLLATVHLGWHFAVDLPAGLLVAALAWVLGPLTVGARRPRRRAGRRGPGATTTGGAPPPG